MHIRQPARNNVTVTSTASAATLKFYVRRGSNTAYTFTYYFVPVNQPKFSNLVPNNGSYYNPNPTTVSGTTCRLANIQGILRHQLQGSSGVYTNHYINNSSGTRQTPDSTIVVGHTYSG